MNRKKKESKQEQEREPRQEQERARATANRGRKKEKFMLYSNILARPLILISSLIFLLVISISLES